MPESASTLLGFQFCFASQKGSGVLAGVAFHMLFSFLQSIVDLLQRHAIDFLILLLFLFRHFGPSKRPEFWQVTGKQAELEPWLRFLQSLNPIPRRAVGVTADPASYFISLTAPFGGLPAIKRRGPGMGAQWPRG